MELDVNDVLPKPVDSQELILMRRHLKSDEDISVLVSISTTSSASTTASATMRTTRCWGRSQGVWVSMCAPSVPLGGQGFVVIMPDTDSDSARVIAERVRSNVAAAPFALVVGRALDVTVSVGVATLTGLGDSIKAMLKRADEAV